MISSNTKIAVCDRKLFRAFNNTFRIGGGEPRWGDKYIKPFKGKG
jgi:hypothetical protein